MSASVTSSPRTSPSAAPAAISRAASIPCVSGRQRPIAPSQSGQVLVRDVDAADEQHQEVDEVRPEEDVARAEPDRADEHPERDAGARRHEHGDDERRHAAVGGPEVEEEPRHREAERRHDSPLTMNGNARPEKIASRLAGVARSG